MYVFVQLLADIILQSLAQNGIRNRLIGFIGDKEEILYAFADGSDLSLADGDVVFHKDTAYTCQQSRSVGCDYLQYGFLTHWIGTDINRGWCGKQF